MYISFKKDMIKALKRNQIIIFAIALMLVTAGYLNFTMKTEETAETAASFIQQENVAGIGDATLVSSNNVFDTTAKQVDSSSISTDTINNSNKTSNKSAVAEESDKKNEESSKEKSDRNSKNELEENTKATQTSAQIDKNLEAYFTESRLERENMYSEMLESNQLILGNSNISSEQKNVAQTEILNINKQKNAIMIAENLIKNKGFEDVIIFVNNESISIVVRKDKLEEAEIAQIQSIVQRELNVNAENIHISNK